jgi:membrane-associated phospholipid phosphatase
MLRALPAGPLLALVLTASPLRAEPSEARASSAPSAASAPSEAHAPSAPSEPVRERATPLGRTDVYRPLVPADYGLLGFLGAIRFYFAFTDPPSSPTWTGPILFDRALRDGLRATSEDGRETARLTSDILVASSYAWVASDALIAGGFGDGADWGLKWKLLVIDLQALALSATVTEIVKALALRERPDSRHCAADSDYSASCGVEMNESFPSGHSSSASVAAGLVCAHHLELGLYGSTAADVGACVASSAVALTAGTLRIVADRHYATDVAAGLLIGGSIGVVWPLWFHAPRKSDTKAASDDFRFTVLPVASPAAPSLHVVGEF